MFSPEIIGRFKRALRFLSAYRLALIVVLLLSFALAGLNAVEPLVLKYLFDSLGGSNAEGSIISGLIVLFLVSIGRELIGGGSNWLTWKVRLGIHYLLLEATVERLQTLPVSFHRRQTVGAIMTRLDRGIQGFLGAATEIAFQALPAVVYLGISVWIMLSLDWRLAVLVLAFTPLPIFITALASREHIRRERTLLDKWMSIYSRFNEVLAGIITVKSFVMEDTERKRFLRDVSAANRIVVKGVGIDTGIGAAQNLILALARLSAIALGGLLILRGESTLGTLIAFLGYLGGLFGPVQGLTNIMRSLRTASVSLEAVFSILDAPDYMKDAPDARELPPVKGAVRFSKVRFTYENQKAPILDGIDIKVEPGQVIALVGPSGAGKSTMMALLQRLYDPCQGTVKVDGIDLKTVKQRSLRRQIGVVLQEPLLFNETITNNIAYGKPDAPLSEIMRVAKIANAHEFIMSLPDGYDTVIGERGGRLSAGERQRLAIARALLKNPPILILDEATSALDAETESLVQEAIEKLLRCRTTFIIAHRLSTVVSADRILVLKDGKIIEDGTHQELMAASGYYSSLVFRQTRGLLPTNWAYEEEPGLAAEIVSPVHVMES